MSEPLKALIGAESEAALHFDAIARIAEHWRGVVQKNELAEARWAGIRNHARHRASVLRDAIAKAREE